MTTESENNLKWQQILELIGKSNFFDPPSLFAKTLSETLPIGERIIDIGCGTGVIGLYCLLHRQAQLVTFSDILVEAIVETYENLNKLIEYEKIFKSHGFIERERIFKSKIGGYELGSFDRIPLSVISEHSILAFNPPQLPTDHVTQKYRDEVEKSGTNSIFRLAGPDGLKVSDKFFEWYAKLQNPKPKAIILLSSFLGQSRIVKAISSHGLKANFLHETIIDLRPQLVDSANKFYDNEEERNDRSIIKNGDIWQKKLFTISLENDRNA